MPNTIATWPAPDTIDDLDRQMAALGTLEQRLELITRHLLGPVTFSTSLGLEDQAILHAIAVTGAPVDVFMLDTGRHFPETLDVIEASELRYGLKIRVVAPAPDDIEALVRQDGINGFRLSAEARKSCCDVRKVRPLRRALAGAGVWITGLRREQSTGRQSQSFATLDSDFNVLKVNPLADWSLDRLQEYVQHHDVPVNALHAQGFPSIGCQPCTRAVRPGEDIRSGRWWWESAKGRECGLHRRPPNVQVGT